MPTADTDPKYEPTDAELEGIDDDDHPAMQKAGFYHIARETEVLTFNMVNEFIEDGHFDESRSFQANVDALNEFAEQLREALSGVDEEDVEAVAADE